MVWGSKKKRPVVTIQQRLPWSPRPGSEEGHDRAGYPSRHFEYFLSYPALMIFLCTDYFMWFIKVPTIVLCDETHTKYDALDR